MSILKKLMMTLLAVLVLAGSMPLAACNRTGWGGDKPAASALNGLLVKSNQNADFPSRPQLSGKAMRQELNTIAEYARQAGYNAILFEVRSQGESLYRSSVFPRSQFFLREQGAFTLFDPLKEMIKAAKKQGLTVYAVVDPYSLGADLSQLSKKHPAVKDNSLTTSIGESRLLDPDNPQTARLNAKDLGAMAKRYALDGIIFENAHATDGLQSAVTSLMQGCRDAINSRTQLGLMLPDGALEEDFSAAIALADFVLPIIEDEVNPNSEGGYADRLAQWRQAAGDKLAIVLNLKNDDLSAVQLSAQAFEAARSGVMARVVTHYGAARNRADFAGDLLASSATANAYQPIALNYTPPETLTITRPTNAIVSDTANYCIMGGSDPDKPLTLDGQEVQRGADGLFAVLVPLKTGDNSFVLRQGENSQTVAITRPDGGGPVATTINVTGMAPRSSLLAYNGVEFSISCVAPAGKTVTATLGGATVTLTQNAVAAPDVPAVFSGKMTLTGAGDSEVKNLGPITYAIAGGESAVSGGSVYLLGHGATPYARVTEFVASVFPDSSVAEGNYKSVYKAGVVEEIADQMGEYYELASGGYIKKATVEVVDKSVFSPPVLTGVTEQHDDRAERFILTGLGGVPYTFVDEEDGRCTITLHQANAAVELNTLPKESELFAKIAWSNDGGALVCTLTPRDAKRVWGIDILNQDNGKDALLYAKRAPKLSDTPGKPMAGVVVLLDPGHGGTDTGAPSTLGALGPYERDVNLADARMLKMRLEQLGATVELTRTDNDTTLSLYDRMAAAQKLLPDFFMSMHHNSVAESQDANLNSGVEAYYYEPFGRDFAEAAARGISENVFARDYRFSDWSYYTVTRMRYAPSILCEIGFMPNPTELKRVCDLSEIHKTADALALAMLKLIATANQP